MLLERKNPGSAPAFLKINQSSYYFFWKGYLNHNNRSRVFLQQLMQHSPVTSPQDKDTFVLVVHPAVSQECLRVNEVALGNHCWTRQEKVSRFSIQTTVLEEIENGVRIVEIYIECVGRNNCKFFFLWIVTAYHLTKKKLNPFTPKGSPFDE